LPSLGKRKKNKKGGGKGVEKKNLFSNSSFHYIPRCIFDYSMFSALMKILLYYITLNKEID
jgi:hypothetical protein